jgi:hypothetical protein
VTTTLVAATILLVVAALIGAAGIWIGMLVARRLDRLAERGTDDEAPE